MASVGHLFQEDEKLELLQRRVTKMVLLWALTFYQEWLKDLEVFKGEKKRGDWEREVG